MGIRSFLGRLMVPRLDRELHTVYADSMPAIDYQGQGAEFSLAYLACELAKMRPIAALPVDVYQTTDQGRKIASDDASWHLAYLLKNNWNPFMRSSDGIHWAMITRDTLGEAYVRVEWGTSQNGVKVPVALWPIQNSVDPLWDERTRTATYSTGGDTFTPPGIYTRDEILVFRSPLVRCADGFRGRSLAEAASNTIGLSIDLEDFYSSLLTEGNHFTGYLETDKRLTADERAEIRASLDETKGPQNAGKIRIFQGGVTYHSNPLAISELDLVGQQTWILQQTCRICGVPPQEVYDLSHATYSNAEQGAIQFAQKTLMPECRELEATFDGLLRACGCYDCHVKFDMNGLLRGTYQERMEGYKTGVYAGFFTRDDVRGWEELPPLPGLDRPLVPVNYNTIDEKGDIVVADQPDLQEQGAPAMPEDPGADPVLEDMRERIRARIADKGDTPSVRAFAVKVLTPYARACALAGKPFDTHEEIEELLR